MSEVYLYDDKLLIYYNINKNHPELAKSDLALLESDGFDQRDDASTITRAYEHLEITWVAHVFALTVKAERP